MSGYELTVKGRDVGVICSVLYCTERTRWLQGYNHGRYGDPKLPPIAHKSVNLKMLYKMGYQMGRLHR